MKLSEQQSAFLSDVAKLIQFIQSQGYTLTGGELYRPDVTAWINALPAQSLLTAQSPQGGDIHYHDNVGGIGIAHSLHTQKLAIDLNVIKNGVLIEDVPTLTPIGNFWIGLSPQNRAGMFFLHRPDFDHYERQPV